MNKKALIDFEEDIKNIYLEGKIKGPVHFSRGNEDPLIEIFTRIKKEDWVFSTHRSHYHALLKGIDPEWVKEKILKNKSMHLNNKEHNFFTSSIVGGCAPIALGVAISIKRKDEPRHVWVFVGDMAAEAGSFCECAKYAARHNLPITFIIEDNGLSTNTPTQLVWGEGKDNNHNIIRYSYERYFPHIGCGQWVVFS